MQTAFPLEVVDKAHIPGRLLQPLRLRLAMISRSVFRARASQRSKTRAPVISLSFSKQPHRELRHHQSPSRHRMVERYDKDTTRTITWKLSGSAGSTVEIDLVKGGLKVDTIADKVPIGSGGKGYYSWFVGSNWLSDDDYKISVQR